MAKFYTNLTAGDTVTGIQNNGGEYGISISQDLDCQDIACRNVNAGISTFTGDVECNSEVKCTSTTAPFYPPVVTSAQRNAMTNLTKGAIIYNSSNNKLQHYNGSDWANV
tara:strand:+ start:191 stop:520 length:330 start_codon:yes stop_codon:yes gene_type:complete